MLRWCRLERLARLGPPRRATQRRTCWTGKTSMLHITSTRCFLQVKAHRCTSSVLFQSPSSQGFFSCVHKPVHAHILKVAWLGSRSELGGAGPSHHQRQAKGVLSSTPCPGHPPAAAVTGLRPVWVQISRVDQEILSAVQHQSSTGSRARCAACFHPSTCCRYAGQVIHPPQLRCPCVLLMLYIRLQSFSVVSKVPLRGTNGVSTCFSVFTWASVRALLLNRQDLGEAKAAMAELYGRMGDIRRKAQASEAMVQVRLSPVSSSM